MSRQVCHVADVSVWNDTNLNCHFLAADRVRFTLKPTLPKVQSKYRVRLLCDTRSVRNNPRAMVGVLIQMESVGRGGVGVLGFRCFIAAFLADVAILRCHTLHIHFVNHKDRDSRQPPTSILSSFFIQCIDRITTYTEGLEVPLPHTLSVSSTLSNCFFYFLHARLSYLKE